MVLLALQVREARRAKRTCNVRGEFARRPAEYVHAPAIMLGLSVQPDVLEHLSVKLGFRGRGLFARILYALPVSTVGRR